MPPRRPHPFLDSASKKKSTTDKKSTQKKSLSHRTCGLGTAADKLGSRSVSDNGELAKTRTSKSKPATWERVDSSLPKAQQDEPTTLKPKGQLRERSSSSAGTKTSPRLKKKMSSEPRKERVVPVSIEWSHEYGAHAHMFKQPQDVSAEHVPGTKRASSGINTTSKAVVIRRATTETKRQSKDVGIGRSSSSTGKHKDSVAARDLARPRSNSTPPDVNAGGRSPPRRSKTGASSTTTSRKSSTAVAAAPPRSMPRKWVETPSTRGKLTEKRSSAGDAAVVRFGLYRGVFNLVAGISGVRGLIIDEEFNMTDSYMGNYTFKVRGPGMMGPYLKEHGSPPEGERSYLAGGGDCVVNLRPGKEYWVEVVPCNEEEGVIQQKIDIVESEMSRLTTIDAVARATHSVSPHSPSKLLTTRSHSSCSRGSPDTRSASSSTGGGHRSSSESDSDGEGPRRSAEPKIIDSSPVKTTTTADTTESPLPLLVVSPREEHAVTPLSPLPEEASSFELPPTPNDEATQEEPAIVDPTHASRPAGMCDSPSVLEKKVADQELRIKELKKQALQMKLDAQQAEIDALQRKLGVDD